jgi:hypothetical protein
VLGRNKERMFRGPVDLLEACHEGYDAGAANLAYAAPRRTKLALPSAWLTEPSQTRAASTASTCGRTLRPWRKPVAMAVLGGDRGGGGDLVQGGVFVGLRPVHPC